MITHAEVERTEVAVGVDAHKDCHVAVAINMLGVVLGTGSFATTAAGHRELLDWVQTLGLAKRAGMEGTGSYEAGLPRAAGVEVVEVNRPNRAMRRRRGKSDVVDAEAAARSVLSGEAAVVPKNGDGPVGATRVLKIAEDSAVKARVQAVNRLRSVLVNAGTLVREPLEELPLPRLIVQCAPGDWKGLGPAEAAVVHTLGCFARRIQFLDAKISDVFKQRTSLIQQAAPDLLQLPGIGPDSAAALLIAAGGNPRPPQGGGVLRRALRHQSGRGISGKTSRRRLSRGGSRPANPALFRAVLSRLRWDPATQEYARRRTTEGLSKREIIRCLKRYLARTVYEILRSNLVMPTTPCNP
ncbi:transposase [Streptomyces sp. NPDC004284]|uniref:IS110 family transposase n=1 Tax=Streptomyces sp. NPDC004284 TaxID=3364695 RepID=UPI00368CB3DF